MWKWYFVILLWLILCDGAILSKGAILRKGDHSERLLLKTEINIYYLENVKVKLNKNVVIKINLKQHY